MANEVLGRDYPRCQDAGDEEGMAGSRRGKFYETLHGWIVGHEAQRLPMKVVPDWLALCQRDVESGPGSRRR